MMEIQSIESKNYSEYLVARGLFPCVTYTLGVLHCHLRYKTMFLPWLLASGSEEHGSSGVCVLLSWIQRSKLRPLH